MYTVSREATASESAAMVSTPRSKVPASIATSMLASMRVSSAAKSAFCSSIGQRQQPVEELRHGRQVLLEVALICELEPGGLLEAGERPALDVTAPERDVELAQCRLGVGALQVVAGPEERGVVAAHGGLRVALAARDGAEGVQPPGDGGDEAALALHVGGDGPEQRGRGLVRAVGAAQPLDRLVGPPAGLQQIVDAALGVGAAEIGVIAAPDAAGHAEHQDALGAVHEGGGLGEVGRGGPRTQREALALRVGDLQHPARAAGDLGHGVMAEAVDDLVERRLHRRQRAELLDERVALRHGLLAEHRVAVGVEDGPRHDIAVVVGEGLLQLHREGVRQEIQHVLARREVDGEVVPFGRGNLGDAALHQRLAGGDQLHHGGAALLHVRLDGADQRGALHRGQEVAEEALLGALEGRQRGRLRVPVEGRLAVDDAGRLQGLLDIGVDDLEGAGIGVVDAPLLVRERVLQDVDLDPVVGERPGLVETEGLEVARHHFHRRYPAGFHGGHEGGAGLERGLARCPEPEAPCIGEAGHRGGAGGGYVENAGVGQGVLQPQTGTALLRGPDLAARALRPRRVGHGMGLVEDDDAGKGVALVVVLAAGEPGDDLVEA